MSDDGDTVVSTGEQRKKQNDDSACGASQSPEKEAKGYAKKPANPCGPRPYSYPLTSVAGANVKSDGDSAKTRPHSYPGARSKRSLLAVTIALSEVPSLGLTNTAVEGPPVTDFSCVLREYPHDIVIGAQFVQVLPHSANVSASNLDKIKI